MGRNSPVLSSSHANRLSGNSTAQTEINKVDVPSESVTQKWNALSPNTKVEIYAGGGAAIALIIGGLAFVCIRQRSAGKKMRNEYDAKIEKDRADAYNEQIQLREKGIGGWDQGSKLGEDALGGWGGDHHNKEEAFAAGAAQPMLSRGITNDSLRSPGPGQTSERYADNSPPTNSRMASPASFSSPRNGTPASMSGYQQDSQGPSRMGTPAFQSPARIRTPSLASPTPQSAHQWNEGAFTGNLGGSGDSYNAPRSPGLQGQTQMPSQQRGYSGGNGYSKF